MTLYANYVLLNFNGLQFRLSAEVGERPTATAIAEVQRWLEIVSRRIEDALSDVFAFDAQGNLVRLQRGLQRTLEE